jgi:PEP-CTERM motif
VFAVNALDVPEPSTLALAFVGLVLLARRRARI